MTGGVVVVLGPVGANFGAGMTGGRAYLLDPPGRHAAALHGASVRAIRLAEVAASREDGAERVGEFRRLLDLQREAGSALAAALLQRDGLEDDVWLVEPIPAEVAASAATPGATGVPNATEATVGAGIARG
jgi:glutamate synthase domain-containing protein 3